MPTAAQEIAALKRAVKEIENRLDALEGVRGLDRIRQDVREAQSNNDALFKVVLRRLEHIQSTMDSQHEAVMAQVEKLATKPPEN